MRLLRVVNVFSGCLNTVRPPAPSVVRFGLRSSNRTPTAAQTPAALRGGTFDWIGSWALWLSKSTCTASVAFFGRSFAKVSRRSRCSTGIYSRPGIQTGEPLQRSNQGNASTKQNCSASLLTTKRTTPQKWSATPSLAVIPSAEV